MSECMLGTEHEPFLPKILACRTTYKQQNSFSQIQTRAQATITDLKFQIEINEH